MTGSINDKPETIPVTGTWPFVYDALHRRFRESSGRYVVLKTACCGWALYEAKRRVFHSYSLERVLSEGRTRVNAASNPMEGEQTPAT